MSPHHARIENCRLWGGCLWLIGTAVCWGADPAEAPKPWQDIVAHRAERAAAYQRWRLTWDMEYVHPPGTLGGKVGRNRRDDGSPLVDRETRTTTQHTIVFDGPKIRWEERGPKWYNLLEDFQPVVHVDLTDGELWNSLNHVEGEPSDNTHLGWISGKKMSGAQQAPELGPVLLLHQPSSPLGQQNCLPNWRPVAQPAPVKTPNGERLWSYELQGVLRPQSHLTVWIDPARDFVVRHFDLNKGVTTIDTEFQLVSERWVPQSWILRVHLPPEKKLWLEHHCTVTASDFPESIDPATFTMEFPPGTIVVDSSKPPPKAGEPRPTESFLVRADGSRRIITPEESSRLPTYDELSRTNSGEAGLDRGRNNWWWMGMTVGAALLIAAGWLAWRRAAPH